METNGRGRQAMSQEHRTYQPKLSETNNQVGETRLKDYKRQKL